MGNELSRLWSSLQAQNAQPGKVCNHFISPTSDYPKWVAKDANYTAIAAATKQAGKRVEPPCWLHMSESRYFQEVPPRKQVTLLRDPRGHVISQYFHCTESPTHQSRWKFMPTSLSKWLREWTEKRTHLHTCPTEAFHCYNPINMQTSRVGGTGDLDAKFDVVGVMEEFSLSACLIATSVMGKVPHACNCTAAAEHKPELEKKKNSHGVVHHGNSFNTTAEERGLIEALTDQDQKLYNAALLKFRRDVKNAEQAFGVTLCRTLNRY